MGNCCARSSLIQDANTQFVFQGNMTETSDGKGSKLYSTPPGKISNTIYTNFIRIIKEQAEIISETDFLNIISSEFPNLNRILYPEQHIPTPFKNIFEAPPIKFSSGEIYKGQWNATNNKRNGFGISISADHNTLFKGEWNSDKIGDFGLFLEKNGNYYLGEFKEGKFEGKGELEIVGISRYKGDFKNDLPDGKGNFEDFENEYEYKGDWEAGKKNGRGILEFSDKTRYEGEFKNDLYDGKGKKVFENGHIYEGEFKEGNMHGNGVMFVEEGIKIEGTWDNGNLDGDVKKIYNDGKIEELFFSNGICLG